MTDAPVKFGQLYCDDSGLRRMLPSSQSVQVAHLRKGTVVLSCIDTDGRAMLFDLSEPQRDHLVRLLTGTEGAPAVLEVRDAA